MKKLAVVLACLCAPAFAHKVVGIADGDTLTVLEDGRPVKIRLANIDAPEKAQAFGQRSKSPYPSFATERTLLTSRSMSTGTGARWQW